MTQDKKFRKNQIFRADGKGVFMEVLNSAFRINKVQINFVKYDTNTNKQLVRIDTFLDIDDALLLANDILSGRMNKLKIDALNLQKEKGYKFASHIYLKQGGVHAATLLKRNQKRDDGKALAREFKITPGSSQPWILSAEQGPGKEMDQGLIKLEKAEERIMVPITDDGIKKFALVLRAHIEAYLAQTYAAGGDFGNVPKREFVDQDITVVLQNKSVQEAIAQAVALGIAEFNKKK